VRPVTPRGPSRRPCPRNHSWRWGWVSVGIHHPRLVTTGTTQSSPTPRLKPTGLIPPSGPSGQRSVPAPAAAAALGSGSVSMSSAIAQLVTRPDECCRLAFAWCTAVVGHAPLWPGSRRRRAPWIVAPPAVGRCEDAVPPAVLDVGVTGVVHAEVLPGAASGDDRQCQNIDVTGCWRDGLDVEPWHP